MLAPQREGGSPGVGHLTLLLECGHLGDVDQAPGADALAGGVKRIGWHSSPIRPRTPSIQPKHSASSTDSDQVMQGLPVLVFEKPMRCSVSRSWCCSSQIRQASAVA